MCLETSGPAARNEPIYSQFKSMCERMLTLVADYNILPRCVGESVNECKPACTDTSLYAHTSVGSLMQNEEQWIDKARLPRRRYTILYKSALKKRKKPLNSLHTFHE